VEAKTREAVKYSRVLESIKGSGEDANFIVVHSAGRVREV